MIPLIFAQSIMIFPGTISGYFIGSDNPIVQNVANTIYDLFNLQTSGFYWVAVLPAGRSVHVLLRGGAVSTAEHSRESAAAGRVYPGHSAGCANGALPLQCADCGLR